MADSFDSDDEGLGFGSEAELPDKSDVVGKLTKAQLSSVLSEYIGLSSNLCDKLVVDFFDEIKFALIRGQPVKIPGLGTFSLRDKVARPGRNPKTGAPAEVSARRVVTFKPSRSLREQIDSLNNRGDSQDS